ncbi:MAG TPA: transketolase C-terminal domain-containing protein [Candidatus Sulfotelmatobacter sp.]|nr:transketolase C-terminal domain-containing protein [Candidatus Sulfotelmatobacter sp.]
MGERLRLDDAELEVLQRIQRRVLWLGTYMVHHANFLRPNPDGTKVGGHQASSASAVTLLTALYFKALRPGDVVAVKPHAAPAFYAIQYLRGRLDAAALQDLRTLGKLQAYPSRRKNPEVVDLTTGSMGLGAVQATFGALATRYLADHFGTATPERFIVMVGDAELDEGNVYEALLEDALACLGSVVWIVDVNRQSLDRVIPEGRLRQIMEAFRAAGWGVQELRHGARRHALFARPEGGRLRARLEAMSAAEYQGLLRSAPGAVRKALAAGPGGKIDGAVDELLSDIPDAVLTDLLGDLGGHDFRAILEALDEAAREKDRPCAVFAHTIKGWGLPLAADPMNHSMLLSPEQIGELRAALGIAPGEEWAGFPADGPEAAYARGLPPLFSPPRPSAAAPQIPDRLDLVHGEVTSTQEAFGRALSALGRLPVAGRIVTVSADVAVTTHLAGWINRKGVYSPRARPDGFAGIPQAVRWLESPEGQHIELGIAEHNLFLLLGALGLTHELSGEMLLPIGTLYDPFLARGLDALAHALYAGGRFIVVATPSGISLSPEGGAHQSVFTPGIGIGLPGIVYYDPPFAQEVEWILLEGLRGLTDRAGGASLYLRLSTKPIAQRMAPPADADQRRRVLRGAYRLVDARGEPGYDPEVNAVQIFAAGAMVPEAVEAARALRERGVFANVFAVTSPDLLYRDARGSAAYLRELMGARDQYVPVVSVLDGHSHTLAFIGGALGVPQVPLGVDAFGQSGARRDLYRHYGIDADAIAAAALAAISR